jgi:mono/diheme cytochrome c family protein
MNFKISLKMKKAANLFGLLAGIVLLANCGGNENNTPTSDPPSAVQNAAAAADATPASERITLNDKGVGAIKDLTLPAEIDQEMALAGAEIFKTNCTACHKVDQRFIGPSPKGIFERRHPAWVMNMILDPKLMTEQDQCAKDLLVEFNGAAMANQNLTEEQARSIVEYFRTL